MYIYIYIYVYIHTCSMYINTTTLKFTRLLEKLHKQKEHAFLFSRIKKEGREEKKGYIYIYISFFIYIYIYTYIYIYICTYMYIYIYMDLRLGVQATSVSRTAHLMPSPRHLLSNLGKMGLSRNHQPCKMDDFRSHQKSIMGLWVHC